MEWWLKQSTGGSSSMMGNQETTGRQSRFYFGRLQLLLVSQGQGRGLWSRRLVGDGGGRGDEGCCAETTAFDLEPSAYSKHTCKNM